MSSLLSKYFEVFGSLQKFYPPILYEVNKLGTVYNLRAITIQGSPGMNGTYQKSIQERLIIISIHPQFRHAYQLLVIHYILSLTVTFRYFHKKQSLLAIFNRNNNMYKKHYFCYMNVSMNVVKNVPMCHASGSKGSQPHNIQVCRLVLKSLQMKGCVKHQNMTLLVKLSPL